MEGRTPLFAVDPIEELRGLASLTDPDDGVCAVIDLPVIGARGDGKSQFIIHAIRALHAHAPPLDGAELALNRDAMRLVLDPRAMRPEATPPGVVPHFTFRVRAAGLWSRLGRAGAARLAWRAAGVRGWFVAAIGLVVAGIAIGIAGGAAVALLALASGALVGACAALVARGRLARRGDVEVAFWDIAGEQVYSAGAADYYAMLGRLVDARRRRACELGRAYAFSPILICNPLTLGTVETGSPYEKLRQLLPVFGALDGDAVRALVAINRWAIVDPICARGALRDEVVEVTSRGRDEAAGPTCRVSREQVRVHCLDAEDGREGDVRISYIRYDTAIRAAIDVDRDAATIGYDFDDGPGALGGEARGKFLDWLVGLVPWQPGARDRVAVAVEAPVAPPVAARETAPMPAVAEPASRYAPPSNVWSRPTRTP